MAERIVRSWKVSLEKLNELVGSQCVSPREILTCEASSPCLEDVLMTLGDGDDEEGTQIAEGALAAILDGKLDHDGAYEYARVVEPLLNRVALPLGNTEESQILLQLTYYVPNESHGRWNPLLEACQLPKLAKEWAAPNMDFPWSDSKGPDKGEWPWPVLTSFGATALPDLAAELAGVTKERIDSIPSSILADDADDAEQVAECRDEFLQGLQRLGGWIERAQAAEQTEGLAWSKTGNALVLLMDGDQ